jgi:hypothetical protein
MTVRVTGEGEADGQVQRLGRGQWFEGADTEVGAES